jgi:hypothetical protein
MRTTHGGKSPCAVGSGGTWLYLKPMTNFNRSRRFLRAAALAAFALGLAVWLFTGAHLGWTQTSKVNLQRDEITGIEYPVRQDTFVAGVEVPLVATGFAAALAGLSWLPVFRRSPAHA